MIVIGWAGRDWSRSYARQILINSYLSPPNQAGKTMLVTEEAFFSALDQLCVNPSGYFVLLRKAFDASVWRTCLQRPISCLGAKLTARAFWIRRSELYIRRSITRLI
ncbi:hypothetical protein RRG08_032570 [Elysia crispata]|uniref:Uncharacterized protein n=1 Tax=Elysia crispata TaxID=231223 RepID=A0AAE1DP31_9GAST|nr:hypothetical protein RRG08_032570 [Elysia crispata]